MVHVDATAEMKDLSRKVFGYTGRKYQIQEATTYTLQNYWSGGTKHNVVLVSRDNLQVSTPNVSTTNPMKDIAHQSITIPPQHFLVQHSIVAGKDLGITFYVRPDEVATLPHSNEEFTEHEKIVLLSYRYNSSYAGIRNYRYHEAHKATGISLSDYDIALASLQVKGYIAKNKALTTQGKNAKNSVKNSRFM